MHAISAITTLGALSEIQMGCLKKLPVEFCSHPNVSISTCMQKTLFIARQPKKNQIYQTDFILWKA